MNVFHCSKCKIEQVGKFQTSSEGIAMQMQFPQKQLHQKMNLNKTKHFLDFIFCNGLLQDVAYGTTKLNFFNGESQILPHAVITAKYEHIISYYIKFCESRNFQTII